MGKTEYTPEIGDKICANVSKGLSLSKICKGKDMPCERTIFRWLRENDEFCRNYMRAKQEQADTYADQIVEIADEDVIRQEGESAGVAVQRNRLRVDARKWVASKLKPKKYGDKLNLKHDGTITIEDKLRAAREKHGA